MISFDQAPVAKAARTEAIRKFGSRVTPRRFWLSIAGGLLAFSATGVIAAETPYELINRLAATSPITVHELRGGIYMLEGSGGNIGVLSGPDGKLMVDCGIAVSKVKIEEALARLGTAPLRYAINTHWHWDHSDGNAWVRLTGAQLIADAHTVHRLSESIRIEEWGHSFEPVPESALPNAPISGEKVIRLNGEIVRIRQYRPGHTDGDLSVMFERADVLQTGDTYWNGMYPFIDYVTGGDIDGTIAAANVNIALSSPRTLVIPGHGQIGDQKSLIAFRDMLVAIRARVAALKADGKSLEAVQAAQPTAEYDAVWGGSIISGSLFTALVYRGV